MFRQLDTKWMFDRRRRDKLNVWRRTTWHLISILVILKKAEHLHIHKQIYRDMLLLLKPIVVFALQLVKSSKFVYIEAFSPICRWGQTSVAQQIVRHAVLENDNQSYFEGYIKMECEVWLKKSEVSLLNKTCNLLQWWQSDCTTAIRLLTSRPHHVSMIGIM